MIHVEGSTAVLFEIILSAIHRSSKIIIAWNYFQGYSSAVVEGLNFEVVNPRLC